MDCCGAPRLFRKPLTYLLIILALSLGLCSDSQGYAVLAHEAIIDSCWDSAIKPLLLERFPNVTPDELKIAHGYAYGGSVIQDMGYYPFGSKLFSDLVHYVRSGDFIEALLRDSQDLNGYAFALGALAHYVGDNDGHRLATNLSVPRMYPKLRARYGDVVTYDENPAAHLKTEFGFDVLQVARGHYAPDDYRDHIGFEVSKPLLQQAFQETYGLKLDDIFTDYDLALGTYRRAISSIIPKMTKVAWQIKKTDIEKTTPGITRKEFLYNISRSSYNKRWDRHYREPGFGTKLLAFIIGIIPKVGPFSALSFKTPTPETEKLFMASFNAAVRDYETSAGEERSQGHAQLVNDNFDTGSVTGPGQYPLGDQTYANLMDRLAKDHFAGVAPTLRKDLLSYYSDLNAPFATKKNKKEWKKVVAEVGDLKAAGQESITERPLEGSQSASLYSP